MKIVVDMKYKMIDIFPIGRNTSVTIEGNGNGLCNGTRIADENGKEYHIFSVGMVHHDNPTDFNKSVTLLIENNFTGKDIILL